MLIGAAIGGYFGGKSVNDSWAPWNWNYNQNTWRAMGIGAFAGGIGGGLGVGIGGMEGAIWAGIASGGINGGISAGLNGQNIWFGMGEGILFGGGTAMVGGMALQGLGNIAASIGDKFDASWMRSATAGGFTKMHPSISDAFEHYLGKGIDFVQSNLSGIGGLGGLSANFYNSSIPKLKYGSYSDAKEWARYLYKNGVRNASNTNYYNLADIADYKTFPFKSSIDGMNGWRAAGFRTGKVDWGYGTAKLIHNGKYLQENYIHGFSFNISTDYNYYQIHLYNTNPSMAVISFKTRDYASFSSLYKYISGKSNDNLKIHYNNGWTIF